MHISATSPRGFTLIELVIMIVVLSVGLLGILSAINYATQHSADSMIQIRAVELGQRYLDEMLPMRFNENSGTGGIPRCSSADAGSLACAAIGTDGDTRANFDDVDDFNGLVETPAGYTGYSVSIAVVAAGGTDGMPVNPHTLRIDVTVTDPLNSQMRFSAYRVNF